MCLLVDDLYGDFLISLATEAWFEPRKAPPPGGPPFEEVPVGPAGMRWSIGDWHRFPDDDFLSGPTREALEQVLRRAHCSVLPSPDTADDQVLDTINTYGTRLDAGAHGGGRLPQGQAR